MRTYRAGGPASRHNRRVDAAEPDWPPSFTRSVVVLAAALCLAALVVGLASVYGVHNVRSQGVKVPATALGTTSLGGGSEVYVRFLVGDSAVVATAESPGWTPTHGTRVAVSYLPDDPAGSVRIVDSRVGGGYAPGVAGILVGALGALLVGFTYRRSRRRQGTDDLQQHPSSHAGISHNPRQPLQPNHKEPV